MDHLIHRLLNLGKFVIFESQPVTNIDAEGKQCNCNFGNHTGFFVFDKCVITANVNNSTQHNILLCENPPLGFQGRVNAN